MHKLLQRQIKRCTLRAEALPEHLQALLEAVSDAYDDFDADRRLAERALDVSSSELTEINQRLRQEVAERREAEQKLKHTVSLLTATLESTADGILVVDERRRIKDFNKRFQTLWQIPDSILASEDDDRALSFVLDQLKDPATFLDRVQQFYDDPNAESFDLVEFKDGRVFERYSKPQFVGDAIAGRVWCFRDVTDSVRAHQEQLRLVQQFEETNQQLQRVNKELGEFAYVVSHDLKAPLRGIKALAGWIATDYADCLPDEGTEQLDLLLNRVDRMHDLIDGILRYSRLGRMKEEKTEIDLNALLPEIIDMLGDPQNITISIANELPTMVFERTRIIQVFENLLSNAVKYMDKPQGQIRVGCADRGEIWEFYVADNGPGIEERYFERIFQMFQTLSPRDDVESTGIGLTLVKKTIEMYGGRIWVKSQRGAGSTFLFTLPKAQTGATHEKLQTGTAC